MTKKSDPRKELAQTYAKIDKAFLDMCISFSRASILLLAYSVKLLSCCSEGDRELGFTGIEAIETLLDTIDMGVVWYRKQIATIKGCLKKGKTLGDVLKE